MKKIFIIDDEGDFSVMLGLFLKQNDCTVTLFNKSDEALSRIELERPDLVITDIFIENPESGIFLANRIKNFDESIPVIILTAMGNGFKDTHEVCRADTVMQKPYNKNFLLDEIRRLTNAR